MVMKPTKIPLPESWPRSVKRSVNYALQLARVNLIRVRGDADYDYRREVRQKAKFDKIKNELALEKDLKKLA
jgi:hypothetical protein